MSDQRELVLPDLPRHDEAERAVIGGILMHPELFYDVAGKLTANEFHQHYHRVIFDAITRLAKTNRPIDPFTVHAELGSLRDEIGLGFIDRLTNGVPRRANVSYYADLIVNSARLRALIEKSRDVIESAMVPTAKADDVIEQAQGDLFRLASNQTRKTLWWADEMSIELSTAMDGVDDVKPIPPVSVGLPSVDALFDGFGPGDWAVLAGRPSTGKTALSGQIALQAARDRTVLICSLEMKHTSVWRRALSSVARINLPQHQRRPFSGPQQAAIARGLSHLSELKLAIEDMPTATDMQILSTARRVQMQQGLGLIVIDYLQLMRAAGGKYSTRGEELGAITRSLKQIAGQLDVPILTLAALSRAAQNERPNMGHIRECGTAEYDADHIFLMHRDVQAQKDLEPGQPSPAELIVEKQRNGATGSIPLLYFGEHYRFESQAIA